MKNWLALTLAALLLGLPLNLPAQIISGAPDPTDPNQLVLRGQAVAQPAPNDIARAAAGLPSLEPLPFPLALPVAPDQIIAGQVIGDPAAAVGAAPNSAAGALFSAGVPAIGQPVSISGSFGSFGGSSSSDDPEAEVEANILEFETMSPLPMELVGSDLIRGVPGAGMPWKIDAVKGELAQNGNLQVLVLGLTLLNGVNPSDAFRAIVSCQDLAGNNSNSMTVGSFKADEEGNAVISETVKLPKTCLAPAIFITNPDGEWFAVTGVIAESAMVE